MAAPADALAGAAPSLRTSTHLGHREWDEGNDVEADQDGNTHVAGFTLSKAFPRAGAAARRFSGSADAFVTELAPDGSLLWSAPLGGRDLDVGTSLALCGAGIAYVSKLSPGGRVLYSTFLGRGNAYVTGTTRSADFPVTSGARQPRIAGTACGPPPAEPCLDTFLSQVTWRPAPAQTWPTAPSSAGPRTTGPVGSLWTAEAGPC